MRQQTRIVVTNNDDSDQPLYLYIFTYGQRREKTCLCGLANNKGADQPAHPDSLISAYVIRFLESIIYKHTIGEITTF